MTERIYRFTWYPTKDGEDFLRHTLIKLPNAKGKTEVDAKVAVDLFTKSCGNLKKNTVIKIQELDKDGNQIGEDITPSAEENAIVPSGR